MLLQGVIAIPYFEIQRITFSNVAVGILVNEAQKSPIESNLAMLCGSLRCTAILLSSDWLDGRKLAKAREAAPVRDK